ncbi:MAG: hypothetical protein Q8K70_10560 [Bacteroidota bacterium]|nr:hypothetical protein [Bacteroidota bacterium]
MENKEHILDDLLGLMADDSRMMEVRKLKKEYIEADKAGRLILRKNHPSEITIFNDLDQFLVNC